MGINCTTKNDKIEKYYREPKIISEHVTNEETENVGKIPNYEIHSLEVSQRIRTRWN